MNLGVGVILSDADGSGHEDESSNGIYNISRDSDNYGDVDVLPTVMPIVACLLNTSANTSRFSQLIQTSDVSQRTTLLACSHILF